jgi:anti-sigma factor RsiW
MNNHHHDREHCVELADRLSEYLDGELPTDLRERVEAHFEDCANCQRFMTSLRRTRDLGPLLPEVALSPEALQRVRDELRKRLEA